MSDVDRMPSDTITATATQNIRGRQDAFRYIHCYSHTEYQKSKGYLPIHSLLEPHRMSEVDRMPSDTFTATATQNIRRRQDAFRYIHCYSHTEFQTSKGCLPIHSLRQPHRMLEVDRMPSDTFIATATQIIRRRQVAFRYIHCYSHTECQMSKGCLPIHSLLQPHRMLEVDRMPSDTFTATATQNIRRRQDAFRYIHCYSHTESQKSTGCLPIQSLLKPHRISDVDRMPSDTFIATATPKSPPVPIAPPPHRQYNTAAHHNATLLSDHTTYRCFYFVNWCVTGFLSWTVIYKRTFKKDFIKEYATSDHAVSVKISYIRPCCIS